MGAKAFQQRTSNPRGDDHRMVGQDLFAAYLAVTKGEFWNSPKIKETISGKGIGAANPETQIAVAYFAIAHLAKFARTLKKEDINYHGRAGYSEPCVELLRFLFRRKLPYSENMLAEITELAGAFPHLDLHRLPYLEGLVRIVERQATGHGISGRMAKALKRLKDGLIGNAPESRLSGRIAQLLKRFAPEPNSKSIRLRISTT
jgi:hypothetical protein